MGISFSWDKCGNAVALPVSVLDIVAYFGYSARAVKKRLRKKYHVGEFVELGFYVRFRFRGGDVYSEDGVRMLGELDADCLCKLGLSGTLLGQEHGICTLVAHDAHKLKTSEQQLAAVREWLQNRDDLEEVRVSELLDFWHDMSE